MQVVPHTCTLLFEFSRCTAEVVTGYPSSKIGVSLTLIAPMHGSWLVSKDSHHTHLKSQLVNWGSSALADTYW